MRKESLVEYRENPFTPVLVRFLPISLADNRLFGIWTAPS